ncbi:MAG TPA: hypothetical protein VK530_17000 [Candidatus Acidoferrum sp.]|nr:hypothetical protein [Candidatus Acidoferrum sp.]
MQLTLVSHYGAKPARFAALLSELQSQLAATLGANFTPYHLYQIHGTIVGLEGEGERAGLRIRNENFRRHRDVERFMDFPQIVGLVRAVKPFCIRVGGFQHSADYDFTSNGAHPFIRSFSIQGTIAVAMGWPWANGRCSDALFKLRKSLEGCGVLHKWHRRESDRDNDFFFVLGRVSRERVTGDCLKEAEEILRRQLAAREPIELEVNCDTLR